MMKLQLLLLAALIAPSLTFAQVQNTAVDKDKHTEQGNQTKWKTSRTNDYDVPYVLATNPDGSLIGAGGGGGGAATIADGADVTQGAKADAKSTATDTTPISSISILKQISASVQAPPSQAVTNAGTFAVQLGANQSVNVAQVNGVTPLMGAGNTGTGSPRVTIATDNANVPTKEIASTSTNGQVTASTTAATLVAANTSRYKLTIKNTDAAITVYIGAATVTSANGMPLKAGESISVKSGILWQVISASGSPVVAYIDESF